MPPDAVRGVSRSRSPARATVLIAGAVIIGAVALVVVLTSLGGGASSKGASGTSASSRGAAKRARTRAHRSTARSAPVSESSIASSPAEVHVVVLNGTNATGLAHQLSANLQQSGFSQATPLDGTPPGSHQTTVVEYATGDRANAAEVAQALGVSQVQAMETSVTALAGGAPVVVVAGLDKAALVSREGGGEASSGASGATP